MTKSARTPWTANAVERSVAVMNVENILIDDTRIYEPRWVGDGRGGDEGARGGRKMLGREKAL